MVTAIIVIVIIVVILLIVSAIIAFLIINQKKNELVMGTSPYYAQIAKYYKEYSFKTIPTSYQKLTINVPFKRKYDNFNPEKDYVNYIYANLYKFQCIIEDIKYNKAKYKEYCDAVSSVPHTKDLSIFEKTKMKRSDYVNREGYLASKLRKPPPTRNYSVILYCRYTSPQGRNSYCKYWTYSYDELRSTVNRLSITKVSVSKAKPSNNSRKKDSEIKPQRIVHSLDELEEA